MKRARLIRFINKHLPAFILGFVILLCAIFIICGQQSENGSITLDGNNAAISDSTKQFIEDAEEAMWRIMNQDAPTDQEVEEANDEEATGQGFYTTIDEVLGRRLSDGNNDNGAGWQCSRYTGWLATGKWSYSSAHPDYGPVNGKAVAEWLVKNYGYKYIDQPVKGAIGSGGFNTLYGHTAMYLYSTGAHTAMVNDANYVPLTVSTHNMNIDGVNWWLNVDLTKIDVSNNNLNEKCFDDGIHDFRYIPYVKILSMASNKFNIIPKSVFYLQELIFFDISNNMITNIDENLFANLFRLIKLNLSNNKLQNIPISIQNMVNLQELYLEKNELQNIPYELINLKYLKKLNIGWNKIHWIQPNLFNNLLSLVELYCNNNLISNIQYSNNYAVFDSIQNLKTFDLSYNQLNVFLFLNPNPNLEIINISNNKLEFISGISLCQKIYQIDCSNNNLKQFPNEFLQINNLSSLNIKGNELNTLPSLISLMDNLIELNIEGNPLKHIPHNLKYANLSQIKEYFFSRISNEDLINIPINLKESYNKKTSINNKVNSNQNNQLNRNSPIFNYIKNNSELIITNTDLNQIPINDIQQNIPQNFLTSLNFSSNQKFFNFFEFFK